MEHRKRQRIVQNVILIWFDSNFKHSHDDVRQTLQQLRAIINDVNVFSCFDDCLQFISSVEQEKLFLITSGSSGSACIEKFHSMKQIEAIYIYCENLSPYQEWASKWSKMQGVHKHIKPICQSLQRVVKQTTENITPISFVTTSFEGETTNIDLNRLEPSFMYTQLFKRIFLGMSDKDQTQQSLIELCRIQYADNKSELRIIEEFDQNYHPSKAIWWYTRECFTYQLLNRALRCLEADIIVDMGFFIRDLHRQIESLHSKQSSQYGEDIFALYRGQGLTVEAFLKLSKSRGKLLSFNSFLSTSKSRPVSLSYARCASISEDMVGILFIKNIDPKLTTTPFADIHKHSYFETEAEILFSMHTVFRIEKIDTLDERDRLFEVYLTMTGDEDPVLRCLIDRMNNEVTSDYGWERLGELLIQVEHFDKAEKLYCSLLRNAATTYEQGHYLNQLGLVKNKQGDYTTAVEYYERALKTSSVTDSNLASSYNNLGIAYKNMGEYSKALIFYEKALEIEKDTLPSNHTSLATSYNNIGLLYMNTEMYSKALGSYSHALVIFEETLPANHPSLASLYNNIGLLHDHMQDYAKALLFYQKAFTILERTLPSHHSDLATSYNNLGVTHYKLKEFSTALSFFEKALEIFRSSLPPTHPNIQTVLDWMEVVNNSIENKS